MYLPRLHYCCNCNVYLGPDDADGICYECDEEEEELAIEVVQEHEIKDVYRIREGLLVEIRKYKEVPGYYMYDVNKISKAVKGCTGARALKADYVSKYDESIKFSKGTIFMGNVPIEVTSDPKEFRVELRSSGGVIGGSVEEIREVMKKVDKILKGYEG